MVVQQPASAAAGTRAAGPLGAWWKARHILCIRLDTLGDVLMTGPAMRALKESAPQRRITLLTSPAGAEAGRLLPGVDEVLVYEAPWMKSTPRRTEPDIDLSFVQSLRDSRFDAAVIFTVYSQNPLPAALLCYQAGIPRRLAHCRENPYQLLTDWIEEQEPHVFVRHEVQRQLDLVACVGARTWDRRLSLSLPSEAFDEIDALLEPSVDRQKPWLVMHPGASAPSRRYPPEHFAVVAGRLAREFGCQIVFTGTASERGLIARIQDTMHAASHSLAGNLSLGTLATLLSRAPLLVSNNTGTIHVAAAVGTPVVDLYALTNPQHTPWMVPRRVLFHDVPCKFCYKSLCPEGHHDCLRLVSPHRVVQAACEMLDERRDIRPRTELPLVHPRN
ncbi:MAG TPA: lipopolysaccharide heptosyltransferase II [Nitrospira sp.]|nr:lipopolysaccharide heptosyltransferase II [Nitrospira sp.]